MTQIVLGLPSGTHPQAGPVELVGLARRAETAGFDGVVLPEHVVMGDDLSSYPWGTFPFPPEAPWPDPLTVLAGIATVTTSLQLCTQVLIAPLHQPVALAKRLATLDALSCGRLEIGVGPGWQQAEFDAVGVDFARRGQVLTETMQACRALWGAGPATFEASTASFADLWCEPGPHASRRLPVLFAGPLTERNLERIASLGDGWIPGLTDEMPDVIAGVSRLRKVFEDREHGSRIPLVRAQLQIRTGPDGEPDLAASLARTDDLVAAGVTALVVPYAAFVTDARAADAWFDRAPLCLRATS